MARRSDASSVEEAITIEDENEPSPVRQNKLANKKKQNDESFLRHLELEPMDSESGRAPLPEAMVRGGRTPFTTTKQLTKTDGAGFGLSIAWIQPPRVERVEAGQAADKAGIRPGDYVVFVDSHNVVTLPEEQVLQIIKSCGNELTLEIYRKTNPNGLVEIPTIGCNTTNLSTNIIQQQQQPQTTTTATVRSSSTACSTTSTSVDVTKRRLHLPQVAFSNEAAQSNPEESRRRAIYQLLHKEQNYAINLQFGINRFLVPLTERRDFMTPTEHHTLFQNAEELLRITEDILEQALQEEADNISPLVGRVYLKKITILSTAYRRYCSGLKRADFLLVEKSKNNEFTRFCTEPVIPRRRPDLTTFIHKPLEHYREVVKLLQTVLNHTKPSDDDYRAVSRTVQELQSAYREVTVQAGLMEPEVEGRPLLSLQDLESRLVFTRCKPFVLSSPGRQWIFGGDLSRVEGRAVRPFWALLFTDMMVFAKVSRDRVLFITEEPLSLMAVSQAFFNIRKKANEFRLLLTNTGNGTDSPATATCGSNLVLSRTPTKGFKSRSVALRAPTPELKAVWQNLIQRQIIYLNTTRGGTPASSPLDSPDPPTTLSVGTLDSLSIKRQTPIQDFKFMRVTQDKQLQANKGSKQLNELIDSKCRQLGKTKTSKGSALHLAEWMKGQLNVNKEVTEEEEEPEVWSHEELKRRSDQLHMYGMFTTRLESRCEEIDLTSERSISRNTERSHPSHSTSESQVTVKSNKPEHHMSVCKQCHNTCLTSPHEGKPEEEDDFDDNWGSIMMMGVRSVLNPTCGLKPNPDVDPFTPSDVPAISVLPPTPDTLPKHTHWQNDHSKPCDFHTTTITSSPVPTIRKPHVKISEIIEGDDDEDTPDGSLQSDQDLPYRTLSCGTLRRFGTISSLERVGSDDQLEEDKVEEEPVVEKPEPKPAPTRSPETGHAKAWTARAGSFVAEKMAIFERLSSGNDCTVRSTSFLERYLRPSVENHLDSPPDPGTNTSSSGRGEDEGETSGATSGEEVWGTPTSGGEFEEDLGGETSAVPFMESPRESVSADDDTEQLMEDLLISLPMLAARAPGIPPRRRLEPLPEEDDTESSSAPCSPKPLHEIAAGKGRNTLTGYLRQHHDNCPKFGSSTTRPLGSNTRPGIGTIDRVLGGHRSEDDNETADETSTSPSFFNRLRLRKNRDDSQRKSNRLLGFLGGRKVEGTPARQTTSAAYGGKPLFKYLFNKDTVDEIPTTLPREFAAQRPNDKQLERRFWKQLSRRRTSTRIVQPTSPQVAV